MLTKNKKAHMFLSNPVKTTAIASAKVKTDKADALTLANLLRTCYIPESYIPPRHIMDLREMVRYRTSLARMRVEAKIKIHAIILQKGTRIKEKPFTIGYISNLRQLE